MSEPIIRAIKKEDNTHLAKVIRKVLVDLGVPKVGTAYAELQNKASPMNWGWIPM